MEPDQITIPLTDKDLTLRKGALLRFERPTGHLVIQ